MNLLDTGMLDPAKEVAAVVWEDTQVRIEKIISCGQITPEGEEYCQQEAEWVSVLKGKGILYFPDTDTQSVLVAGDQMMILPGVRHRVIYTSKPCVWLCVFEKQRGAADER